MVLPGTVALISSSVAASPAGILISNVEDPSAGIRAAHFCR
jgi:hypothetical protein